MKAKGEMQRMIENLESKISKMEKEGEGKKRNEKTRLWNE